MANANMESVKSSMMKEMECLIRMDRIMKTAHYFYTKDEDYLKQVVSRVVSDAQKKAPESDAKKIADFVIRTKFDKNSRTEDADIKSNVVACLIREVNDVYLACNFYLETEDQVFQGWGHDRDFLEKKVKEKFAFVERVHFLVPSGQGLMDNPCWKNRECHAEMQLLKFAIDREWEDFNRSSVGVNKTPCIFCHEELRRGGAWQPLEMGASVEVVANWVPPQLITVTLLESSEEESTSLDIGQLRSEIMELKKGIEDTLTHMKAFLNVKGESDWKKEKATVRQKAAIDTYKEERLNELRITNWEDVQGFPGLEEAETQQEKLCEKILQMTRQKTQNGFEEFQKLKKKADEAELKTFSQQVSTAGDLADDLCRHLTQLRDTIKTRHNADKEVAMLDVFTLSNGVVILLRLQQRLLRKEDSALKIAEQILELESGDPWTVESRLNDFTNDMYNLAVELGEKVLDHPEGGHWKMKELKQCKKKADQIRIQMTKKRRAQWISSSSSMNGIPRSICSWRHSFL